MKVVIAGSRNIRDYQTVKYIVEDSDFDITEVVSGNTRGVDTLGEEWAKYHNIPVETFPVTDEDWEELGAKAGPLRNKEMAEYADAVIAIWDGQSPGTRSMIDKAYQAGLDMDITLTSEPPENDLDKEELLRRLPEIDRFNDEFYKPMVIDAFLNGCPEYFWELPTSSTGKYHPEDESGKHGNWLHTRRVFSTYQDSSDSLVKAGVINESEQQAGMAAALLHDLFKYGYPEQEGEHTIKYHDVLGAAYVRQYTDLPEQVAELIETHNGAWHYGPTPRNTHEWVFHQCDMIAARRKNNMAINGPVADELSKVSDMIVEK